MHAAAALREDGDDRRCRFEEPLIGIGAGPISRQERRLAMRWASSMAG